MKFQAPNSNFQISSKFQAPNAVADATGFGVEVLIFFGTWSLEPGTLVHGGAVFNHA
jgi:hypothetical protein